MAPHFGHFTFASLEIPAHPKEKTAKTANAKKRITPFLITIHLLRLMISINSLYQTNEQKGKRLSLPFLDSSFLLRSQFTIVAKATK